MPLLLIDMFGDEIDLLGKYLLVDADTLDINPGPDLRLSAVMGTPLSL